MPITCRNILPRWQGAITLPQGGAAVYLKGSGRLQRQRSISKATVYLKDNGLSQRQRSASKAAVYLKGNGRLQRQWPASKAAVCFKGNGLSQRQWSISKAMVYLKGSGLPQRQWSASKAMASAFQAPSAANCRGRSSFKYLCNNQTSHPPLTRSCPQGTAREP